MKIVRLEVSNFKRVKAVTIEPRGPVVEIAGKNAQGKTSLLDGMMALLMGKDHIPAEPVREGADKSVLTADLGDYVVTRTIKPDRTGTIVVKNKDGARFDTPQQILDAIVGRVAFDPLLFVRLKPAEQLEMLRGFAPEGVDFDALDAAEEEAFDERTAVNREVKSLQAIVDAAKDVTEIPAAEDPAELTTKLAEANERNEKIRKAQAIRAADDRAVADAAERIKNNEQAIAQAEADIAAARDRIADINAGLEEAQARIAKRKGDLPALVDVAALTTKLAALQAANSQRVAAVAKAEQAKTDRARLKSKQDEAEALDKKVAAIRAEREAALKAIDLPVEGLGMSEAGITFQGHPIAQASFAQQLQIGVALAMKANPKLRVARILEGSMLDDDAMATLEAMAEEQGFQVWIERVGKGGDGAVVIEEGEVKGAPKQPAAPAEGEADPIAAAHERAAKKAAKAKT